jgi:hypothetical protein
MCLDLEYAVMGQEPKELNRDALYACKISRGGDAIGMVVLVQPVLLFVA